MTISQNMRSHVRVRQPSDLLGLVPYLLGFHPKESLVVIVIDAGRVELTARIDVDQARDRCALRALLLRLHLKFPNAVMVFVVYSVHVSDSWATLKACRAILGTRSTLGLFYVDGYRWWDGRPDGLGRRYDPKAHPLAAEATLLGMNARGERQELKNMVAPPPSRRATVLQDAEHAARADLRGVPTESWPSLLTDSMDDALRADEPLLDVQCARLRLLVEDANARTSAWMSIRRGNAEGLTRVWGEVVRCTLPDRRVTVLALLGIAAWVAGEGALAVICLEEAEKLAPTSPLVCILRDINLDMVSPAEWDQLCCDVRSQGDMRDEAQKVGEENRR